MLAVTYVVSLGWRVCSVTVFIYLFIYCDMPLTVFYKIKFAKGSGHRKENSLCRRRH